MGLWLFGLNPVLRVTASIAIAHISYDNSVYPSGSGTNLRPGEIEISGFHHMIAYRL